MHEVLKQFLQDIAQGVYGESNLNYSQINAFTNKANLVDIDELTDYYWEWTSALTDEEDIDINELETFIKDVIHR